MERVSAVVETTIAASRVDAVAMRRIRRRCLHLAAAKNRKAEQRQGGAGGEEQPKVYERPGAAPP
jgi:hypothetical protein